MAVLRIRGNALSHGDPVDLFADGDRWTDDPVPGAELAVEGWLIPGLVDAHTHPGAEEPGKPLDEAVLRDDLRAHLVAGVTMIRSPGLAGDPPAWFGQADDLPRAVHAGRPAHRPRPAGHPPRRHPPRPPGPRTEIAFPASWLPTEEPLALRHRRGLSPVGGAEFSHDVRYVDTGGLR